MENYGILLVDDEPVYRAIVTSLLAHCCTVDASSDGHAARQAVGQRRYDLILVDIELHNDEDGYEVATALRASGNVPVEAPIIAFTTLTPDGGEDHFVARGFDGWLPKPFAAADLYRLAARWLGAPVPPTASGRLADLLGAEGAARMIDRLFQSFAEALEAAERGASPVDYAHRLGGLAGTLGFASLAASWLALQYGDLSGWPTVEKLTREALAAHMAAKS